MDWELNASNVPDRGTVVYTATDGIISMTPMGINLYFGTGGEAGAYYGSEPTLFFIFAFFFKFF